MSWVPWALAMGRPVGGVLRVGCGRRVRRRAAAPGRVVMCPHVERRVTGLWVCVSAPHRGGHVMVNADRNDAVGTFLDEELTRRNEDEALSGWRW